MISELVHLSNFKNIQFNSNTKKQQPEIWKKTEEKEKEKSRKKQKQKIKKKYFEND